MSMTAFLGLKSTGTGDLVTDQRPKSWREQILYLYPNGMAPLTALLSQARSEAVSDPEYNWWDQTFEMASGTITGVYLNTGLSTAYSTNAGAAINTTIYLKMAAADASLVQAGHVILLRDPLVYATDVVAKVTAAPTINGASSYLTAKILEADDNGGTGNYLDSATTFIVIGTAFAEGASMPLSVTYKPVKNTNYTQIFRTSLEITRTMEQTKLRTQPQEYQRIKAEALKRHSMEMEMAFWYGIATETNGDGVSGKPERTTKGLLSWIRGNTYASTYNVSDYSTADANFDGSFSGKTWIEAGGGKDWFNEMLERAFRYGSSERLAMCGNGALLGIQRLVEAHGQYNLQAIPTKFGMNVTQWTTPFGTVYLKTHPMWNTQATTRKQMVLFEPSNLIYRYIQDTKFYDDPKGNNAGTRRTDGKYEEFLTECGLEMHHPETCAILNGVGSDNAA